MGNAEPSKALENLVPEVKKITNDAIRQAKAGYENFNSQFSNIMEHNMKTFSDVTEFTKGNVDALVASAKAAQQGAETISTTLVETSKKCFEETQAAFKALTTAKSPNELVQLQNNFARSQFDQAVSTMSQLSEVFLKVTGEVVQPLSNRVAVATETAKKAVSPAA